MKRNRDGGNLLTTVVLLVALCGCHALPFTRAAPPSSESSQVHSIIAEIQPQAQEAITTYLALQQSRVIAGLEGARYFPAEFKRPLAVHTLNDPWAGLETLEQRAMQAANTTGATGGGSDPLPALIDALEAGMNRFSDMSPSDRSSDRNVEQHLAYLKTVLEQAHDLREKALRGMSPEDRQFLFDRAASLIEHFSPQLQGQDLQAMERAKADRRFGQLIEQMDYAALVAEARLLAQLDNDRWLRQLTEVFQERPPVDRHFNGVTGDLLLVEETPTGLIIIGGTGPNTYQLDQQVALVIDVGGDDVYKGTIAAPGAVRQSASVVIDLSGNDTYRSSPLGLGTGRLGVGLLIERSGDDLYEMSPGSGGAGFAGIGLLHDRAGRDRYIGSRLTQGAAIGGLGLLIDDEGNDLYTGFQYAVGFGGPLGVGAVLDVKGDDSYQCGEHDPSDYNNLDAPDSTPGDPRFQYDAFGIGVGVGSRVLSKNPQYVAYNMAGGWGLVIDREGNDRYRSSNFSQGLGYFYGMGTKLDLNGDDEHTAARYGHGAGAHYGVGLFIDAHGRDRYASTGPFYNGGTAWDLSVSLCIDADVDDDIYDLSRSDGLGRADHRSWSVFIEEGGSDRYVVPRGMGMVTDRSVSAFMDLAGEDDYAIVPSTGSAVRGNGTVWADQAGGLFLDR